MNKLHTVSLLALVLAACPQPQPQPQNQVGSTGGTVNLNGGTVKLVFPANAVSNTITVSATTVSSGLPSNRVPIAGTGVDLGPDGSTFAQPVALSLKYDPSKLPVGTPESALSIAKNVAGAWEPIAGSTVNEISDMVTANLNGFSQYAVVISQLPAVNFNAVATRNYGFTTNANSTYISIVNNPDKFGGIQLYARSGDISGPMDASNNSVPVVWSSVPNVEFVFDEITFKHTTAIKPTQTGTYTITANANGAVSSVVVNVVPRKVWHASWREFKIRGYNESKWGTGNTSNADTTLDLSACGNAKPNDIVQDTQGNLIFTDNAAGKVIRINYSVFSSGGSIAVTSSQCRVLSEGHTELIGLLLDYPVLSVEQLRDSLFFATQNGVYHLRYNNTNDSYAQTQLLSGVTASGLAHGPNMPKTGADTILVADYGSFNTANAALKVYQLDTTRTTAGTTLRLNIKPLGSTFALPEGVVFAADRYWVSNNQGSNLMGFAKSDIENQLSTNPNTTQNLAFKSLENNGSTLRCPGGLALDHLENLWVNVQGANGADCGSQNTPLGNVSKFSSSQLIFNGNSSNAAPTVQLSGIASVPGYGGLVFGR
jgi:hypothetical protein